MPIIYLGLNREPSAEARRQALIGAGLGTRKFWCGVVSKRVDPTRAWRLFASVPPAKFAAIEKAFPIVPGKSYWRATYLWEGVA